MIIEQTNNDTRTNLKLTLDKLTKSFSKRSVAFIANAHSGEIGEITIIVTGKKGSVQKTIIVILNQSTNEWEAYCDGTKFILLGIGEISTIVKSLVNNLSALLLKV